MTLKIPFYRGLIDTAYSEILNAFTAGGSAKKARKIVRFSYPEIHAHMFPGLPKYAKIEPHIMPITGSYSRSGSDHFPDRPSGNFT
jgi:hypothetical protein